jgi:hypothetical protein
VALFRWAVSERKLGHGIVSESVTGERRVLLFPRLERVAPDLTLPRVEIQWTKRELESLAALASKSEGTVPPMPSLEEHDEVEKFDCGDDPLNRYFKRHAWTNQEKISIGVGYVAAEEGTPRVVLGYFTLAKASVPRQLSQEVCARFAAV